MLSRLACSSAVRTLVASNGAARHASTQADRSLDMILGGDLSLGMAGVQQEAEKASPKPNKTISDAHLLSGDLTFCQNEAQAEAQARDSEHLMSLAEKFFSKAGANWELEFSTLQFESTPPAKTAAASQARSDW
eukprot:CAMPEP_0181299424 /NCGR_PEP_ID=MMETSP1101-20121128/6337_1 /TAXON_ID=46948 /ORGANISM="Rhodomonas abbreviata, Strain Caron Lab Isolate" /LENGTH=133 /DNA_ID=CAMNT_0023404569 /DNA_START=29 /DNA_END=427 /DNA_ORIENTATION=+